jgi:hypothetical protein
MGIPPERRAARLRVVRLDARNPSSLSTRFPATFRTGATRFAGREIPARTAYPVYLAGSGMYADKTTSPAAPQVQESDIWKISDSRLFFFNQLRGLQVIETADPSDPKVISSLRMPAVGEDMYLLPGSRAVLLRRDWLNGGTTGIVLVDTSKAEAKILAELQIPGWYADSRIVNGRLVLLTSLYNYSSWQVSGSISVISDLTSLPKLESQATLDFSPSTLGVGSDYLWVSGSKNWAWNQSNIELYKLADLPAMGAPLRAELGGVVYDKFKVHQKGDKLFAITQKWGANWQQSTALESYSLDGDAPTLLQRLPLVEGESLHATRFDGNRAYVVTFQQIDPLWIIDLSNPASMQIEAELQVPGWSSYIQPVGNFLAAVGVESGKVTASLFNVEDPRSPFLSSRIEVGDGTYSWSEANWNEKAVAILPAADLILLPYSSFDSAGEASAVQLVDMDTTSGQLTKRGIIRHAFTPRRATQLREGILASLSNRELLLLDSGDRSSPALLSEVSLAFGACDVARLHGHRSRCSDCGGAARRGRDPCCRLARLAHRRLGSKPEGPRRGTPHPLRRREAPLAARNRPLRGEDRQ